ncbi:hypothetical protein PILCRDRAFT_830326 [Piloderma croceum F 1598]|uniref:Uncharacterized protein n=1 Tax=Piloderma croceum (strain F 1598) TaxID=765440 RepID=A0A0C3ACD7_PILCF|nr:hypothetical protein PILCRDRAFT_830326 [Piloderma croceum F 1598]
MVERSVQFGNEVGRPQPWYTVPSLCHIILGIGSPNIMPYDPWLAKRQTRTAKLREQVNRPANRTERRKLERLKQAVDRAKSRQESLLKECEQVDARGSTFNDVQGNQINIIVNNPTSTDVEQLDEDIAVPENPDIDPELNKYPPLIKYGLDVIARTTTLITTNIAAAAVLIAVIPETVKSNIQSMTIKKTSFRYSFFPKPEPEACESPLIPACPVCFHALP